MDRQLLLLGLLRQSEMHGYKLVEFIERDLAICTDLKKPTAYFLLDKLSQAGLVQWTEAREGHRPLRRTYQITPAGEALFQTLLRESLARYEPHKFTGDVALAFAEGLPRTELLALLSQRRAALAAAVEEAGRIPAHHGYVQLMVDHQRAHLEAELRWMDELLERLASESPEAEV